MAEACPECGAKIVRTEKEYVCESCGLVSATPIFDEHPGGNDADSATRDLSPKEQCENYRLKRIERRTRPSRERTAETHAAMIRAECSRLELPKSVAALAVLLNPNVSARTRLKHRVAATIVVAGSSLGVFVDRSRLGWSDARLRSATRELAQKSGVELRPVTVAAYVESLASISIPEEPFTLQILSPSTRVVALLLARELEGAAGSPRVWAGAILDTIVRYTRGPVPLNLIAERLGVSPQAILRAEKVLPDYIEFETTAQVKIDAET